MHGACIELLVSASMRSESANPRKRSHTLARVREGRAPADLLAIFMTVITFGPHCVSTVPAVTGMASLLEGCAFVAREMGGNLHAGGPRDRSPVTVVAFGGSCLRRMSRCTGMVPLGAANLADGFAVVGMGTVGVAILVILLAFGPSQGPGQGRHCAVERKGMEKQKWSREGAGEWGGEQSRVEWGVACGMEWTVDLKRWSDKWSQERGSECSGEWRGEWLGNRRGEMEWEEWIGELGVESGEWWKARSRMEESNGKWNGKWIG